MERRNRTTSLEAFEHLKKSGKLLGVQLAVYSKLFEQGPLTIKQVARALKGWSEFDGTYSARFAELRDLGLIQEVAKVECDLTGRKVIQWDVTDRREPLPRLRRPNLRKQVANLQADCRELISSLNRAIQRIRQQEVFHAAYSSNDRLVLCRLNADGGLHQPFALADRASELLADPTRAGEDRDQTPLGKSRVEPEGGKSS